jgi:hypothetical protein
MRVLADKINQCASGESIHYSALYMLCEQLARGFINADFDKAFQMVHNNLLKNSQMGAASGRDYEQRIAQESLPQAPDLSEALYE